MPAPVGVYLTPRSERSHIGFVVSWLSGTGYVYCQIDRANSRELMIQELPMIE